MIQYLSNQFSNVGESEKKISRILDLIKAGDESLVDTKENAIILLGNTGSGKTSLAYYVAGDLDDLIGTDECLIKDLHNKIGFESTITSKTSFPELVVDTKTNTFIYDCPGFNDTRSEEYDISGTYLIKKIIDTNKAVKLVCVVNSHAVTKGQDRRDFMDLVKQVTTFIKDIDKLRDSIAMVVTKVDSYTCKRGEVVPLNDNSIVNSVAKFLLHVREDLRNTICEPNFKENALKFIDALLTVKDNRYIKIGIFKKPTHSGRLSNSVVMQEGRTSVAKVLHENITFTTHMPDDFGYTLSEQSKKYVLLLISEINHTLSSKIKEIGEEIEQFYRIKEEHMYDINRLFDIFQSGYDRLTKIDFTKPQIFLNQLEDILSKLQIKISKDNRKKLLEYYDFLKFIESVSSYPTADRLQLQEGFKNIIEYVNDSQKWYSFLLNLSEHLLEYHIQQNRSEFNFDKTQDLRDINGKKITETVFEEYLNKVLTKKQHDAAFSSIKDIPLNKYKVQALNNLLDQTVNFTVETSRIQDLLVIKGQVVKFSDFNLTSCSQSTVVMIFALNKVIIDVDFVLKTEDDFLLAIVAPKWEVLGKRKIILDGVPGKAHRLPKARSGNVDGSNGEDGEPGLPGGNGGHFFGVGEVFSNAKNLTISANGGPGGPGQDGGNGARGRKGNNPGDTPDTQLGFRKQVISSHVYRVFGSAGGKGGNGGNGGVGGIGGHPGNVTIVHLDNANETFLIETNSGETGLGGEGGIGGDSGPDGDNVDVENPDHTNLLESLLFVPSLFVGNTINKVTSGVLMVGTFAVKLASNIKNMNKITRTTSESISGNSGNPGVGSKNRTDIEHPGEIDLELLRFLIASEVLVCKHYLRDNLSGNVLLSCLKKFLKRLENHPNVNAYYDGIYCNIRFPFE